MATYSDERRIAALLRELIQQSGTVPESVDGRLGWERGRLGSLLDSQAGLSFETLLQVLPVLDETPGDFFARLCGFHPEAKNPSGNPPVRPDHRFEESRRVVKAAIARRSAWKQDRIAS
jgi:hypothetical protein